MREIDDAVAAYRKQLAAEAELAAGDLDEIEDHLRALTADLRERGMSTAAAVAEAARRLGDPRALAREQIRVRTAFGSQLSRARAWSAALLMTPLLVFYVVNVVPVGGIFSRYFLEWLFGTVLAIALVARISWARPILLGGMAFYASDTAMFVYWGYPANWMLLSMQLALLAFLAPWRRGELSAAGFALALQVWTYGVSMLAFGFQYTRFDGSPLVAAFATAAFAASLLAVAGGIMRARWSALASIASAISLGIALVNLWPLTSPGNEGFFATVRIVVALGIATALGGAALAWRTARSRLGTLAHVLH